MAAWARIPTSFSSLPTTTSPSSSSPSSSASLPPLFMLDLADELWYYRSVLPLPPIIVPCFPNFTSPPSSPPDTSTLIAQCMYDGDGDRACFAPALLSSSSSSSPPPRPADLEQTQYPSWYLPAPSEDADHKENGYLAYNYGYSSTSDSDEDESYRYPGYSCPAAGEDEEAYHYYTAASDWDDEDNYNGCPALSDYEEDQPLQLIKEDQLPSELQEPLEPEDALSGIYDVAVLLKDQHYQETGVTEKHLTAPPPRFQHETVSQLPALPYFQVSSGNDQADMKENLKLWAHAVALTLPWKAAAQARPLL